MFSCFHKRWLRMAVIFILPIMSISLFLPEFFLFAFDNKKSETYLGPGDAIRVLVWDGRDIPKEGSYISNFNREFVIDGRGFIRLSNLGETKISGFNAEEVADILKSKFKDYARDPIVVVIPLIRVTLYGAFRQPGTYRVAPDMTFWELVDKAGGPLTGCNFEKIRLERKGEVVIEDFLSAFERAYSLKEIGIQSGDQIFAPLKRQLSFTQLVTYSNFGISLIMMYLTVQNYRAWRRY